MEEDLFDGYGLGLMSPGRITQLAVDASPKTLSVPTMSEVLGKQTDTALPTSGSKTQVKSSPAQTVMPNIEPAKTSISEGPSQPAVSNSTINKSILNNVLNSIVNKSADNNVLNSIVNKSADNNVSNSTNSLVNNSFDYSKSIADSATDFQIKVSSILSELNMSYRNAETLNQAFSNLNAFSESPSYVINQAASLPGKAETSNPVANLEQSKPAPTQSIKSILELVNSVDTKSAPIEMTPSSIVSASPKTTSSNKRTDSNQSSSNSTTSSNQESTDASSSQYSLTELLTAAESGEFNPISESTVNNSYLNKSTMIGSDKEAQVMPSPEPLGSQVSIKSTSPIKNKSVVNQIVNPPNPVAQGVDNLGKVITNTSESMTSSITEKLSTMATQSSTQLSPTSQTFNTNNNSTVNQASQSEPEAKAEQKKPEEETEYSQDMSSYYLQAIYDALIVQGIKIRTI